MANLLAAVAPDLTGIIRMRYVTCGNVVITDNCMVRTSNRSFVSINLELVG